MLAAFREIYDGHWVCNVGSDGGQTIEWRGRIVVIAAVTTAWDAAHAVMAAMGDRFVLLRINSKAGPWHPAAGVPQYRRRAADARRIGGRGRWFGDARLDQ